MARSVKVELILDAARYIRGSKAAKDSNDKLADSLSDVDKAGQQTSRSMAGAADEMSDAARATKSLDREIEQLTRSLRESAIQRAMGGGDFTKQIRDQERQLRRLTKDRKLLGDPEEVATGFVAKLSGRLGPLIASMPMSGPMLAVMAGAAAVAAPTLGATIAAAVVGGAGMGGVSGGLALAARDPRVQTAAGDLGEFIMADLQKRAGGFIGPALTGIAKMRNAWSDMGSDLDRIFASSRFVDPLVEGVIAGGRKVVAGLADAVDEADPVMRQLGNTADRVGAVVGNMFSGLAQDAEEGASALDDLTIAFENAGQTVLMTVHNLAQVKGVFDQLDRVIDNNRYRLEDLAGGLDLTADGFEKGSAEADAYRRHTLGFATASDYALLKQAGLSEQLGGTEMALAEAGDAAADAKAKTDGLTKAQKALENAFVELAPRASYATALVDGMRKASDLLFGSTMRAADANQAYEASWDSLSDAVKANGRSLNIHTAAGRSNRDAVKDLLARTNDLYYAEIETGMSIEKATKKHNARIVAVKEEARRVGLNKQQTDRLIATYGRIPPRKSTDLMVEGINRIVDRLTDLYIFQRSLATGKTLKATQAAVFGGYGGDPRAFKAAGGAIHGQGHGTSDSVPVMASRGEHMWTAREVAAAGGHRRMEQLRQSALNGAFRGYAAGGPLAPVDTSRRWPFAIDVGGARIPSRREVASKVTPAFGAWPSSPGAQRGDSGVWKQIIALVRGSGIPFRVSSTYRHGDPLWHGSGRAVDFGGYNQDRLARFFLARQSKVLELIHRSNSRDYGVTRGRTSGMGRQWPLHRDHLHIAMARGGAVASAPQRVKVQLELVPGRGMSDSNMGRLLTGLVGAQVSGNGGSVKGLTH